MKRSLIIATTVSVLIRWTASECINGLTVSNQTKPVLLGCNELIDYRALWEAPFISFSKATLNDTYVIMLLETLSNQLDAFRLKWLLAGLKLDLRNGQLQTKIGVSDLAGGYSPPINRTRYELRLYNMTGKPLWDQVSANEKNFFVPSQWLAKYGIYTAPLAQTVFMVKDSVPSIAPAGGFLPMPVGGDRPYPTSQYLPVYPSSPQQQPSLPYPPQQPSLPYPPQQPSPPYPPPSLPGQRPPYPVPGQPQPPQPHPTQNNVRVFNDVHPTPNQYIINGTVFRRLTPGMIRHNILEINSTNYSSDSFKKRYTLSPYLIIDNRSYIWRNQTHVPGKGSSVYINGTQYVPYNPPSNEIHHYHYHKGSASSLTPALLRIAIFIPLIHYFSQSWSIID